MLLRIARHEVRDVVRDGRFQLASGVVLSLLSVALLTGAGYQRSVSAEHASASHTTRETWLTQPPKDPHTAAHYGAYAFKPRGPLTLFDSGINAYAGVAAFLEAHKQNEFQFRPAQDRSSVARLGQLTAAATLQFLVPILVILLAFTKFAAEREDGMLRQLAASGVAPSMLAAGKAAGVAAALGLVLVPATALGAVALLWTSGVDALSSSAQRVAGLVVVYGLYFIVFIGLALAVSAWAKKASHALAVLIAIWAVNGVLAPRMSADLSRWLHPTPTAFEFAEAVERDTYDGQGVHEYNVTRAANLRARLLTQYHVSRVQDLPVNFRGMDYLEREAHANAVWDTQYHRLWDSFRRQAGVHHLAGFAAPLMAVRGLSMALTGVDFFHHQDFAQSAEAYRRRLVLAMNSALAYDDSSARLGAYTAAPGLWETIPAFEYHQPPLHWSLSHVWPAGAALLFWVGLAALALAAAVSRVAVD